MKFFMMAKICIQMLRWKGWSPCLIIIFSIMFVPVGSETHVLNREYLSSISENGGKNTDLNNRNIDLIELNAFHDFRSIESLNLSQNGIMYIRNGTFRGLRQLRDLDLNRNGITTIKSGAFSDLSELRTLDLRNNDLPSLSNWLRESRLENLENLYLDFNKIPLHEHRDFEGLSSILHLHLSGNDIREVVNPFSHLNFLHKLNLSHNDLRGVSPNQFHGLRSLRELDLQHNNISAFAGSAWAGLDSLLELRLCYNRINALNHSSFSGLSKVHVLYIRYNTISTLQDGAFTGLDSLQNLYLSNNRIKKLPTGTFRGLRNRLNFLHLEDNLIQALQDITFSNLSNLERLHLNGNAIEYIVSSAFSKLKQLNFLNLSNNALTTVPRDIFWVTTKVKVVDLSNNDLTTLPPGLFSETLLLRELDISNNNLETLSESTFALSNVDALELDFDLQLSTNSLHCNCTLEWLRLNIQARGTGNGAQEQTICESPSRLHGRALSELIEPLSCNRDDVSNTTTLSPDQSQNKTSSNSPHKKLNVIKNVVLYATLLSLIVVVVGVCIYCAILKRGTPKSVSLERRAHRSPVNTDLDGEGVRSTLADATFVRFGDGVDAVSNRSSAVDSFSTFSHTDYHREREELSYAPTNERRRNSASTIRAGVQERTVPLHHDPRSGWPVDLHHNIDLQVEQHSPISALTRTYFEADCV